MLQNAAQTYQNNSVTTATPEELTLMLYNGAIKFIKGARSFLDEKRMDKVHENCIKVENILEELMSSLNQSYPIAKDFIVMYEYMLRRIVEANIRKDAEILIEVEELFTEFRDTWKEAMVLAKKQR
ncbi:flagellar export chaperone FliS [Brevibacillus migulae]|uniref:flagellar export chaperone FliS n=1 Tax=Brevibacillus migulae TaxID=1644114 RepID=UPI00106E7553|nr:flagellar export chaperone FliS [Brevibacillus migulae]